VATNTIHNGATFTRSDVPEKEVPLYKNHKKAGEMGFYYGHVGDSYGWIAADAFDKPKH
jgi:hypothetical protein